jgi:hypothetical protein
MKITRHNTSESYNTTVDWLKDFADKLKKEGNFINNFNKIKKKYFSTIDEKMADIKQRVGFDIIKSTDYHHDNKKSASKVDSSCTECKLDESTGNVMKCKKCSINEKIPEDTIKQVKSFIQYALDFLNHNEGSTIESALHSCKNDPGLRYSDIENYIDFEKLKEMLKKKRKVKSKNNEQVKYIVNDSANSSTSSREDDMADYFRHAIM